MHKGVFENFWACQWLSMGAQRPADGNGNGVPLVRARGAHCGTVYTQPICRPFDVPLARAHAVLPYAPCARTKGRAMALPTGLPRPEGHSPLDRKKPGHWLARKLFCRARPVRAPMEGKWLCPRQSHCTKAAGGEMGRERRSAKRSSFRKPCPPPPAPPNDKGRGLRRALRVSFRFARKHFPLP
jgi:hypothetical protein